MTIQAWLQSAVADAERRTLPELKALLEALARSLTALRAADFTLQTSDLEYPDGRHRSRCH